MVVGHISQRELLAKLADTRATPHAYLFHGSPWVGKFLIARTFAHYCEEGVFDDTSKVLQDSVVVSPGEGGIIGIDAVRSIKQVLWGTALRSPYRIVIVNDAHVLTTEAQNALLKIAEEPPENGILILVTHSPQSLLPTVASRFSPLYFPQVPLADIAHWLIDSHGVETQSAKEAADKSFGSPGLAISLLQDAKLQASLASARQLFTIISSKSRAGDFIKDLVSAESFQFSHFLDMVILLASWEVRENRRLQPFWHHLLKLRGYVASYNLNPKLQLEYLLSSM